MTRHPLDGLRASQGSSGNVGKLEGPARVVKCVVCQAPITDPPPTPRRASGPQSETCSFRCALTLMEGEE